MGSVKIDRSRADLTRIYGPRARHLVRERADEIKDACEEECPVGDREYTDTDGDHPGVLYRSHEVQEGVEPGIFPGFIFINTARYASFVFDGRGPEGPRLPNRWMSRGLDRVAARHRGAGGGVGAR